MHRLERTVWPEGPKRSAKTTRDGATTTASAAIGSVTQKTDPTDGLLAGEVVEALLEPAGVRTLGACQGLEPLGDLFEAFVARRLGEPRIHLRVLVRLAGYGGFKVLHT